MIPKRAFCCHLYLSRYYKKSANPLKRVVVSSRPIVTKFVCSYCGKDPELYLI